MLRQPVAEEARVSGRASRAEQCLCSGGAKCSWPNESRASWRTTSDGADRWRIAEPEALHHLSATGEEHARLCWRPAGRFGAGQCADSWSAWRRRALVDGPSDGARWNLDSGQHVSPRVNDLYLRDSTGAEPSPALSQQPVNRCIQHPLGKHMGGARKDDGDRLGDDTDRAPLGLGSSSAGSASIVKSVTVVTGASGSTKLMTSARPSRSAFVTGSVWFDQTSAIASSSGMSSKSLRHRLGKAQTIRGVNAAK